MDVIVLIGRILFAYVFLTAGVDHILKRDMFAGFAKMKRVPLPLPSTLVSGAMILVGSVLMLLGIWADLGALLIAAFCIATAVLMHNYWTISDPQARAMDEIQFKKDTALGGAALMLFAFFAYAGHNLGLTITGPLFH